MTDQQIFTNIQKALAEAPRNQYTVEMHLQMIKYADSFENITAKKFCEGVALKAALAQNSAKCVTSLLDLKPLVYKPNNFKGSAYIN